MERNKVIQSVYTTTLRRIGAVGIVVVLLFQVGNGQFHWTRCSRNPVMPTESLLGWDSHHVVDPCVLFKDGYYHMWYAGWADYFVGKYHSIGYAISLDGFNWFRYAENPVIRCDVDSWTKGGIRSPSVSWIDDKYIMMFTIYPGEDQPRDKVGLATSSTGVIWEMYPSSVLSVGPQGSWDSEMLGFTSSIIEWDGKYWVWYAGAGSQGDHIGAATSVDMVHWIKYPNNPVLLCGQEGEWDCAGVTSPNVYLRDNMLEMWYNCRLDPASENSGVGIARSSDAVHWEKSASNPVFGIGEPGEWDDKYMGSHTLVFTPDSVKIWYTAQGYSQPWSYDWNVGVATLSVEEFSSMEFDNKSVFIDSPADEGK